ncbi:MAG: MCE family protein [bacterium]|nr:MCE family protein [bacterium]
MKLELKVGIAVLMSIAIIIGGIMWGKGYRLNAKRYEISVLFTNTGGLEVGANVLANGVVKGRVKHIDFQQGYVRVTAKLDDDVILFTDYLATIESPTVMAGQVLSLYTGTSLQRLTNYVDLKGSDPQGMAAVMIKLQDFTGRIEVTLNRLDSVLLDAHAIMGDTANQANLSRLMSGAAGVAEQSNELLRDNRQALEASLRDLRAAMAAARELAESLNGRSDGTMARVDSALSELTGVAGEVRALVSNLNSDQSSIGLLMNDDEFYRKLNATLTEVDLLSYHLRTVGLRHKIVLF